MNKLKNLASHDEYWTGRAREIFEYVDRKDIDFFAELEKTYRAQSVKLQRAIFDFYTKYAENHEMTYQDAMKRLRGEDLSDYVENARKYREQAEKDPELLKRLNEQYSAARAIRIEALHAEAVYRAGVLAGALHKSFEKYLYDVAEYAYKKAHGGRTGAVNRPAFEEVIKTPFNGRNYSEQLWGNTDTLADSLKKVFRQGFIRGDSPHEMAREIRKEFNVARSRAETLVRTDATAIINRATIKRYKREGLKYYRILVVLDDRTTQICRRFAQEDKLYKLEDAQVGVNMPPFHYNCRSTIIPDEGELNGEEVEGMLEDVSDKTEALFRNKDSNKRRPINIARQNRLTRDFRQNGGVIFQSLVGDQYLKKIGAAALNYNEKTIILPTKPTISEVLEELYHAEQYRNGKIDPNDYVSKIKAEIDAQNYLLSVEKRYNIPRNESEQTKKNLKYWKEELKKYED
jgi:minor head protein|nr:MAG TPA: minor capsid protein [Caudoviricetes sp.]